ncbi:4Fe-4S cluster protein [Desulfonema limicola]|uniref:4Fe-4S cluster protein n=1 Tax=Desulfonema limicola TaxID=45656 RepID=A0A975BA80_9BACT|nr:4Fe-4S binding protein [Desulfonema limicola]QTA81648.1 4Fe-4S cluster protein [Desulfonema limicola]
MLKKIIQFTSLAVFIFLLGAAVSGFIWEPDIFLRLDPGLAILTIICSKAFTTEYLPAVILLMTTPFLGRIFCGYICPMGTTIDYSDACFGNNSAESKNRGRLLYAKYLILIFIAAGAVLGVSLVFTASPLSLITRFYGLLVYPVLAFISEQALNLIHPLADRFDWRFLSFASISAPRFASRFFILFFFAAVFACIKISPRFWCRYICPSGAVSALFSYKPLIRRQVSEDCINCGKCAKKCPMNAIDPDKPETTLHMECIVCRTCETVCPVNAVKFGFGSSETGRYPTALSRRNFVYSGFAGAAAAVMCMTGLDSVYGKLAEGQVKPPGLLRPPGSLPEPDFLALCVRCGECMAVCPTNTLQPLWFKAGFTGIFSPAITPRRRYCDPRCSRCGQVCPTGAIQELLPDQRIWAKTGTAVILRQKCLAWEHQKSCMVCDEVCPFNAIEFKKEPGNPFAVPHVKEDKCAGCGYCEHFCPVQNQAAIVISPMGELRLSTPDYEKQGKAGGLDLRLKAGTKDNTLPYSVEEYNDFEDIAPGFDHGE